MTQKTPQSITTPHDQFFQTAMSNPQVAREFLTAHLPHDLAARVDFDDLTLQSRSFFNEVRQESKVDVLFKTSLDGKDAYLYVLCEHQSSPDELMPFRILKYSCQIIERHLKQKKTKTIPLVYPVVVYHGKSPYPYSTNIQELVDAPKDLVRRYFLKPFQLIDLGQIEDDTLKERLWAGVMELTLKHIFARDILPHLQDMAELLHRLVESDGKDFVGVVLQYMIERAELNNKDDFFRIIETKISPEVGDEVMTLAQQLREEGREEGMLEGERKGKLEAAQNMLSEGADPTFVSKVTQLPLSQIKALQKQLKD